MTGLRAADRAAGSLELPVLLFIAVSLPWEFTKTWFPTPLLEVSRIGILAALGILLVRALAGNLRIRVTPLLSAIGAVAAVYLLSYAMTRWPNGLRDASAVLIYAGLAVFTAHVLNDRGRVRALGLALAMSAVIVAIVAIGQEVGNFYLWQAEGNVLLGRRNATFGDPNVAARFLSVALVACLAVLAATRNRRRATLLVLAAIPLIAIAEVLTLSRIGWLLAAVALVLWIPFLPRRALLALGMTGFVVSFAAYLALAPSTLGRAESVAIDAIARTGIGDPGDVAPPPPPVDAPVHVAASTPVDGLITGLPLDSVRKYLVRAGTAMAIDHPLLGVGIAGYQPMILSDYWGYVPSERRAHPTSLLHTDAVRVAAETGLVGVGTWLWLLAACLVTVVRAARSEDGGRRLTAWAAGSAVLLILIASQFAGRFFNEPFLWLALGTLVAAGTPARWAPISAGTRARGST